MDEAREFSRRMNLAGVVRRYLDGGRRSLTVVLMRGGRELGSKTTVTTRGRITSTLYVLPEVDE